MTQLAAPLPMENNTSAQAAYATLRGASINDPDAEWVARMLASRMAGHGRMPGRLGLQPRHFGLLMAHYFPGIDAGLFADGPPPDLERADEITDLRELFLSHCHGPTPEQIWFADILAAGCMGSDHLWQDLGLWSRQDLSALITSQFPALAVKNDRDMKWKKFFYKQLCSLTGIYTCRSPSCEVCIDYPKCYGPE